MRINELKRIAEENGYVLTRSFKDFRLTKRVNVNYININYININSECENKIWVSITTWCDDKDFNMIKAAVEFAETPIEEREEEKKFYLEHRYFRFYNGSSKYLGMDLLKDKPDLYSKIAYEWVKNQFTLKEIEEIKKKFDTDLADFELVEVEE